MAALALKSRCTKPKKNATVDEDQIGLAVVKREGWKLCVTCQRSAPPGSKIIHQHWCTPYERATRWERFVKSLDVLRFWKKGSWRTHWMYVVNAAMIGLILWGSWNLWRIFINYMVECPCP